MAEGGSHVCPVCLEVMRYPRVLPCLHSMCKQCIDRLDLSAGSEGEVTVRCPICRFPARLPTNGAGGLPRDLIQSAEQAFHCERCEHEGENGSAEVWCPKCTSAFCQKHAFQHLKSGPGHTLEDLPEETGSEAATFTSDRLCPMPRHNQSPLKYFCRQCSKPVCGDCVALGEHNGHTPIDPIKDVATSLQRTVREKTEKLRSAVLPSAESTLSATKEIIAMITRSAENTRSQIHAASKRAIDAIELIVHEKITEVDDLEERRLKHLTSQEEELNRHADNLKGALAFSDKLWEQEALTADAYDLLSAVNKRVDALEVIPVTRTPVRDARLASLDSLLEEELVAKAREIIGDVRPFQSSRTCVVGGREKVCVKGEQVTLVVSVNDDNDQPLTKGGDDVSPKWLSFPGSDGQVLRLTVKGNANGTYNISFTPKNTGEHLLQVTINGVELQDGVSILSVERVFFDAAQCQSSNKVSDDMRMVTHTGKEGWASVLGSRGMKTGRHVWKVRQDTKKKNKFGSIVGVAEKSELISKEDNYQHTFSWHGRTGDQCKTGDWTKSMSPWQQNDDVQLELDCDKHVLTIRNLRSGDTAKIEGLPPAAEFFPYFALNHKNDNLKLIDLHT